LEGPSSGQLRRMPDAVRDNAANAGLGVGRSCELRVEIESYTASRVSWPLGERNRVLPLAIDARALGRAVQSSEAMATLRPDAG
jgi:hypothetical protein